MIVLGTVFSKENLHLFTRKVFSGLQIKIGALTLKPFLILDSELKVKSVCDLCTQQPCCHLGEKLKPCSTVWGPFLPSDIQHFIEIFLICSLKGLVLHCHSFFVFSVPLFASIVRKSWRLPIQVCDLYFWNNRWLWGNQASQAAGDGILPAVASVVNCITWLFLSNYSITKVSY